MNFKDIEYFNELIITKNFSIVAQKFNVSQPTITMAIKRLETEFNAKFFIRDQSHKKLIVTDAGKQFYQHTSHIAHELEFATKEIAAQNQQKITIGIPPIIGTYYFPPITPELLRNDLLNDLTIISRGSTTCKKMLLDGDLDLSLIGSNGPLNEKELVTKTFAQSPYRIIVGKGHPWAQRSHVSLEELRNQPFISQNESFIHQRALRTIAHQGHFRPKVICQTDNVNILKALVAENIGISLLTEIAILPHDQIHPIELDTKNSPVFNMSLAYHARHILTEKQQKVFNIFLNAI